VWGLDHILGERRAKGGAKDLGHRTKKRKPKKGRGQQGPGYRVEKKEDVKARKHGYLGAGKKLKRVQA